MQLTIDGRVVQAESTDSIYSAAQKAGIRIPSLCASSRLAAFGSCRLCICDIAGQSGTPASCTTPVRPDMVVRTDSERLSRLRHHIVELFLSEQPGDVPAPLRELARTYRIEHQRYPVGATRETIYDDSNPFFTFTNSACISCARCVRACDEIQGTRALTMTGRGFSARPVAGAGAFSGPNAAFASSNCVSCGACVMQCPTGALMEKSVSQQGTPTSLVRTTCAYCGVGCAFDAGVREGQVVQMIPADDGPSNAGHACMKGRFGWTYIRAPDRLRRPMLREGTAWKDISWDAALDRIAGEFSRIKTQHGPDALATISSSRGTNEENYLFGKFMRCVMGTNHIDNCARVCHSATVTGMMETLGASAATNSIEDIDRARLIMVVGANPTESHPVLGARIKRAASRPGVVLIVIDPRRTELARLADLHLQLRPGTNVALLNAMGHVIASENLLDATFTSRRTNGLEEWVQSVADTSPEAAERITGVPASLVREAARGYARSGASLSVHGLGMTEHRWGSHGVMALVNLALATGNIGRPGTGINPLRGQNNVQGASDVGCLPTYCSGYQSLNDPVVASRHLQVTGRPLPGRRGMKTPDMWDAAIDGRLKALWIVGYDVAQTDPNLKKVHEALSKLEFLVVHDLFMNETARYAHLVLPAAAFLEKDGTFTNLERRIQRIRKAVDPPDGILPDWQVVCDVSKRMGYPMAYRHPSAIMDEIAALTPLFAGVSYERLDQHAGLQWPVPNPTHEGTPLMHQDTFPTGRARFVAVEYLPPGETADEEYPFILTTGRLLQHYNCGAQTRRTDIVKLVDQDVLEMHGQDMQRLALEDGTLVRLVSRRGDALLMAIRSERVLPGHLFTTFHFPGSAVNDLLSSSADASSKCPEYKVSAVRVESAHREVVASEGLADAGHLRRQLIL